MPHEPRILRSADAAPSGGKAAPHAVGIKETLISLIIAFAMAFVFRGYVVEPFVIPTNSMAPTLLGAHIRWTDPANGFDWPTHHFYEGSTGPAPQQGGSANPVPMSAFDPMTRRPVEAPQGLPLSSGDRIFVLRYVQPFFKPERWDVVVFKTPTPKTRGQEMLSTGATQAFIKRLIGLPGEEVVLFDGDVFTRPNDGTPTPAGKTRWDLPDWKVATKPERSQRSMWQPVFDSTYAIAGMNGVPFTGPFNGTTPGWEIADRTSYVYSGAGATTLTWNTTHDDSIRYPNLAYPRDPARELVRRSWSLTDSYPMDEVFPQNPPPGTQVTLGQLAIYPVSDLRLSAGVQPAADNLTFSTVLQTRGHQFRGRLSPSASGYDAIIEMRPVGDAGAPWTTLASAPSPKTLSKGVVTDVDFWHADQKIELWIENKLVVSASYPWSLLDRVRFTMGREPKDFADLTDINREFIATGSNYAKPKPWFELSGPAELHRVAVARDLYYQPVGGVDRVFSNAAHPSRPKNLTNEQYFVCGDNSPMSSDARAWHDTDIDRWVAATIDPTTGVVNEKLMVGKAFFVYFPAVQNRKIFGFNIPMVDAGRVRWIW